MLIWISIKPLLPVHDFSGSVLAVEIGEMVQFLVLRTCSTKFFCISTNNRTCFCLHFNKPNLKNGKIFFWFFWQLRKLPKWRRTRKDDGFLSMSLDPILWSWSGKGSLLISKSWKTPKWQWLLILWSLTWRILGRLDLAKEKTSCFYHHHLVFRRTTSTLYIYILYISLKA